MNDQSNHTLFMREAIRLSKVAIDNGEGGPFGCVIVKNDTIVGKGYNNVTSTNDPTAHAEITAIRDACKNLKTFQLNDCVMYTSCEPCPMCFGAIYWARLMRVFFANTKKDAARIGFDDAFIYEEITVTMEERSIPMHNISREEALVVFDQWYEKPEKVLY